MSTLAYRIRSIVDDAERYLAQLEIYGALSGRRPNRNVFSVAIAQMLAARQLRRRRATKKIRAATGGRHVYGPGPMPVYEGRSQVDRPRKIIGFMALARMREAARRARRRAARS